jgi:hypothetical protein
LPAMQIVPVVVVLGAVSWVVCAVSVEGEAGSDLLARRRLAALAGRALARFRTARVEIPSLRHTAGSVVSRTVRATGRTASEVGRGLIVAGAETRDGLREDAHALSDQAQAAWVRAWPVVRPYAAVAVRSTERSLRAAATRVTRAGRALLGPPREASPSAQARDGTRRVGFGESLSTTAESWTPVAGFSMPEAEDQKPYRLRGVLGLILLIALIGAVIAAGLLGFGWGVKHMILRGRA